MKDPAQRETEVEWRDPEDASSAMPIRGVLPNSARGRTPKKIALIEMRSQGGLAILCFCLDFLRQLQSEAQPAQ
jgi:hypothetical protein